MEGYSGLVLLLEEQRHNPDHIGYTEKLNKAKALFKQKLFELKDGINTVKEKRQILQSTRRRDLAEITKENEMLLYLSALSLYLESKIRGSESEQQRYMDLHRFQEEIASKYEKQKNRLLKLREYAEKIKDNFAAAHDAKALKRAEKTKEAEKILRRYEVRTQSEIRHNFGGRLEAAQAELNKLSQEESRLRIKLQSIITEIESKKSSNNSLAADVKGFEGAVKEREGNIANTRSSLEESNAETTERIALIQREIEYVRRESAELDEIFDLISQFERFPNEASNFVEKLTS